MDPNPSFSGILTFYRPDIVKNGGVAMFYVHETLHDLGISDLYRYGYQSSEEIFATGPASLPMSDWSIMSNQNGVAWRDESYPPTRSRR